MQLKKINRSLKQKKHQLGTSTFPAMKKLSPFHPALHASLEENLRRPHKLDIIIQSTPPNEDIQECHSWKQDGRLSNITLKAGDKLTISNDYVYQAYFERYLLKMGYSRGFHVWQFQSREDATGSFEVGLATKNVDVDSGDLLGYDCDTYGWSKVLNQCRHNFPEFAAWKTPVTLGGVVRGSDDDRFPISDKFYCILDMDEGYLAFATDNQYSGVAFRGLKGKTLYPIVSTYNECEITMKYLGGLNMSDKPSRCSCKGCTRLVISDYCRDCSAECVIDHEDGRVGEREEAAAAV